MQPNQSTNETEAGRMAALVGTGDLFGELEYIAASPLPEHGGFDPRVVAAATWAAHEIESMRADMNDACITLNSAIEDCDDYAMMNTQQKLTAVRDVLLSYLPNTKLTHD